MPRAKKSDTDILFERLNWLQNYDVSVDKSYINKVLTENSYTQYEALRHILKEVIKKSEGNIEILFSVYNLLSRNTGTNECVFPYHKAVVYYHALKQIHQRNKEGFHLEQNRGLVIVIGPQGCGNCAHLDEKYIDIKLDYNTMPVPLEDCKNGACRALLSDRPLKILERLGISHL
jgi:hypothetical protein